MRAGGGLGAGCRRAVRRPLVRRSSLAWGGGGRSWRLSWRGVGRLYACRVIGFAGTGWDGCWCERKTTETGAVAAFVARLRAWGGSGSSSRMGCRMRDWVLYRGRRLTSRKNRCQRVQTEDHLRCCQSARSLRHRRPRDHLLQVCPRRAQGRFRRAHCVQGTGSMRRVLHSRRRR